MASAHSHCCFSDPDHIVDFSWIVNFCFLMRWASSTPASVTAKVRVVRDRILCVVNADEQQQQHSPGNDQ